MKQEQWASVRGYEGLYEVSNYGKVRSIMKNGLMLSQARNERGYLKVFLCSGGKGENKKVHRLVAEAFLPNEKNLPEVNHINGVKSDNRVENLEWVSTRENIVHAYKTGLKVQTRKNKCVCSDGTVYESFLDAQNKTGIPAGNISQACRGLRKTAGGLEWRAI